MAAVLEVLKEQVAPCSWLDRCDFHLVDSWNSICIKDTLVIGLTKTVIENGRIFTLQNVRYQRKKISSSWTSAWHDLTKSLRPSCAWKHVLNHYFSLKVGNFYEVLEGLTTVWCRWIIILESHAKFSLGQNYPRFIESLWFNLEVAGFDLGDVRFSFSSVMLT